MVLGNTFGLLEILILGSGKITNIMEKDIKNLLMVDLMKENGKMVACMVVVFISGQTDKNMKVNTI